MVAMSDDRRVGGNGPSAEISRELQSLVPRVLERYPEGFMSGNFVPFDYSGQTLELRLLSTSVEQEARIAFFPPNARYSRMTIVIDKSGKVSTDNTGKLPDFDRQTQEPDFSRSSPEELALEGLKTLLA